MYNATNVFENTVRGNDRKFIAKIKCGKNESTDAIKSLKQYSQLPSDSLTIGGAFTSTLELALWNPDFSLQNKEFQVELGLEIEDGTTEWCPLGYYTSESLKRSTDGMITITAYDRIYSKMSSAYFSKLTYPADAIDVLNEISQKTGVEIQTANLTSGVKIQKRKVVSNKEIDENGSIEQVTTYENPFDGYTYREALGYIAMLFCKYAIADRNGSVKLVWFNEIENYKITADYYYELTTDETAFSIGKITCNTGEKELEVGSGTNNIQLSNPIMTQERLNYIYDVAKTLTFIPSSFPFYGDMRLDIGDVIKVVKTDGSIYSVPIMSVTQEFDGGLRTSVQSFGGLEQEVETKGPLATRLERQYTELLLVKELVGEKASFDNLYALSGEFGSLKADYGEFEKLVTEDFKTVNADIINLKSNSITTDNLDAKLAEIGALTAETADLKYATIVDLNALSGKFEELSAKSITTGNLSASVANLGYLKTDEADIKYAKIETLETEYLQLKNLSAETAKLGYLTAIEADIGYAKIDFSNVGKQVVSSSMIMDSAVTNEKVANLSANKITSGTIDASMIRVINLNADNLTVGTINGKLIGNGSVDLDRLSEEVPTKEYLDEELSSLKAKTTTLETSVGNKVEKSVFNELKQTVEENSSKIVSLTTTVSKKADSSTVETLTNNVNEIRQTATQNTASISGMKADIEKKADGSTVSSLATKVSSVEQNLDGFKTTVSNTYTTKEDFNTLEIGGRNLWLKTKEYDAVNYEGWVDNNDGNRIRTQPYTIINGFGVQRIAKAWQDISQRVPIEPQTYYTLSAWIKWEDDSGIMYSFDCDSHGEQIALTNEYKRVSRTFNSGNHIESRCKFECGDNTPYLIYGLKLEKGTKATDWTPAPEDMATGEELKKIENRVEESESDIIQLSNRITTEVSERTALGTKVSSLEQTASGLTVRLNNTESTANTALTNANKAQNTANNAVPARTHIVDGNGEANMYVEFAIITIKDTYANYPAYFKITGREFETSDVQINFGPTNTLDPPLASLKSTGGYNVWMYKKQTSTWGVITKLNEPWGRFFITDFHNNTEHITFTWTSIKMASLPSGCVSSTPLAAATTATNYLNFSNGGLVIGNLTASTLGRNVLIDSDSVDIRNGTTVLATFAENLIELGKNSTSSVIGLCGGKGAIKSTPLSSGSPFYGLELSSDVILKLNSDSVQLYGTDGSSYQGYVNVRGSADTVTSEVYMMATASDKIRALIDVYCDDSSGFIKESVTDGSNTNDLYIYPSHTFFKRRIELANNQALRGTTTDGQTLSMVHMSSNDTIVLGYGSYTNGIGKTVLSGNGLEFLVKTAGTRYKPYYEADLEDGEVDTWRVNGLVTTSKTQIVFMIPLGKPVIGNPTITVTSMMGLEIRQNGKYTHGSALNQYIIPDSYKAALIGGNCIHVTANVSDTTNAINNETCFIRADIAIEFE